MDATCAIQASIHVFSLVRKYVSRILGTYHRTGVFNFLHAKSIKNHKPFSRIQIDFITNQPLTERTLTGCPRWIHPQ